MPVTRMRAASDGAAPARRAAVITAPPATEARSPSRERSLGEVVLEERSISSSLSGNLRYPGPGPDLGPGGDLVHRDRQPHSANARPPPPRGSSAGCTRRPSRRSVNLQFAIPAAFSALALLEGHA